MYIEERVEQLEKENQDLRVRLERLEKKGGEAWVSPVELSRRMECSVNTIYLKVRAGEIYATRRAGSWRIPMSQFYEVSTQTAAPIKKKERELSLKEQIFGEM